MTLVILRRELAVIGRTRALWVAMAVQVAFLIALLLMWGDGMPVSSASPHEQFAAVHLVLSAFALPWVVARCAIDGPRELAARSAMIAAPPSRVLAAHIVALVIAGWVYLASAAPLLVLSGRTGRVAPVDLIAIVGPTLAAAIAAAGAVSLLRMYAVSRALAWLLTTLVSVGLLVSVPAGWLAYSYAGAGVLCIVATVSATSPHLAEVWPEESDAAA